MKRLYQYLKLAESEKSYQKAFDYEESKLKPKLSIEDKMEVDRQGSEFEKNRLMKILASRSFNKEISLDNAYWIINAWGGIGPFKKNERNDEKIKGFLHKVAKDDLRLTKDEFSTISSLSKLSFFFDVEKYCIYDSRVIYSLNWIIFKAKESDLKFFPVPNGRNKTIVNYPIDALIKFSLLEQNITQFSSQYYSHKEAYLKYNELMKDLSSQIFGEKSYPFFTEMLLFGIADKYVHDDMKKDIEIKVKSWGYPDRTGGL